jgi:hypothetical protein|tara:strand:+ start:45 stop:1961 length:1917 start_codon:yes stop_codon:yes gene_type:complete
MDDEFKKQLLGVTTEVGGGIATDVATTPLLAMGPAGIAAYVLSNFGQGAYTNYLVQKHLYGNENINWGEVLGSGVAGAIPFMNIPASKGVAKVLGQAGSIKRGFTGGLATSLVSEQTRVGIDENRLMSFEEMAIAAGVGSVFGGGFTAAGKGLQKANKNRLYKKYYGNYGSPAEAARAKYNVNSDIQGKLYSQISSGDYDDLPVDPKIGQKIQDYKSYAASDEVTEKAVNNWMARMNMPKNADGEYVFDYNIYLDAIRTGKINSYTDARIFIGTFQAAGAAKAGKKYEQTLRDDFITRYKTLFDVLGIPDSHFQPHHILPLKASMPLYHGLVYGSEDWWKLTAHLLRRNIVAGDSEANLKMLIGAGQKTMPRLTRTPLPGQRTTKPVPGATSIKTPHSIQHAYLRDKDVGIGESGQYFFNQAMLTKLKNEPNSRIPITDKFLKKMRRGFELTNDAEVIYNGLFDMRNYDQNDLKLNMEQLAAVLNKLDNDGYLADYHKVKPDFQVDLMSKIIKQVEKDGNADAYRRMVDFERIEENFKKLGDDIELFGLKLKRFDQNLSVDDYKLYMAKVLKRNAAKFSFVSDEDDAATMAELALRPLFVGLNGQKISYPIKLKSGAEGNLTYELAVEIFAKIIYESM